MEFRQLKTFVMVAELLSFNRAAERLNYSQSAVSTQIRMLEETFGQPLFDRLGKTIVLTEAGQLLLRYAGKLLTMEKETIAQVSGWKEPQGEIAIRMPQSLSTCILPDVLKSFQQRYPKVEFDVSSCSQTVQQELRSGVIDLAFLLSDSIHEKDLVAEVIGYEKLYLVAAPDHPLALQPNMDTRDLSHHTILIPKQDCSYKMIIKQVMAEAEVSGRSVMELNSLEAIKQCVSKGVGVTLIPEMAMKHNHIVALPWPDTPLETAILMIRHKNKWISPVLKTFMDLIREKIHRVDSP